MSAELALQKADTHLCVELHRKVRIRLHPSMESICGIASNMGQQTGTVRLYLWSFVSKQS